MSTWATATKARERSVPGAVVTVDPYHRRNRVLAWQWITLQLPVMGGSWRPFEKRVVVIFNESKKTVLFREGPYSSLTRQFPNGRSLAEISEEGIEGFLRGQQIVQRRIGPVTAKVPSTPPTSYVIDSIRRCFR